MGTTKHDPRAIQGQQWLGQPLPEEKWPHGKAGDLGWPAAANQRVDQIIHAGMRGTDQRTQ